MQAFEYANPKTTEEAVKLLASEWGQTAVLAGGTDLVSLMKDYVSTPNRVVSLKHIKELRGIEYQAGSGLRLGATVTLQELIDSADVKRHYPALLEAAAETCCSVRAAGTIGLATACSHSSTGSR